jgi:universal stress protein F
MFRSILVPIDISHKSSWQFAIPEALALAKSGQSRLTIMTVIRDLKAMFESTYFSYQLEQMIADARGRLYAIVDTFHEASVKLEQEVRFGSIGHEIIAAAKDREVDLIIMASHRPEMLDYMIGPNAAHVAQHAPCSVLVLRKFAVD